MELQWHNTSTKLFYISFLWPYYTRWYLTLNIIINRLTGAVIAARSFALITYSQSLFTGTNPKPHQHLGHRHTAFKNGRYHFARHCTVTDTQIWWTDSRSVKRLNTEATFQKQGVAIITIVLFIWIHTILYD